MEGGRCVELDLTSEDYPYHGLARLHSAAAKREIAQRISGLTGLKKLNLRRNKLLELPESFKELAHVEFLDLGSNYLGRSIEVIRELRKLKYLSLANNDLKDFPSFVGDFIELEYLTLHKNIRITRLDESLANLKKLRTLNLYFLNFRTLPPYLLTLRNLTTLTLWNVTNLDDVHQLENLEYFTDNGAVTLKQLPDSFVSLKKLRMARLYQNQLQSLPASFGELENLEQLSLYQNELSSLPESVRHLKKLQKLNLGWNRFTVLPSFLGEMSSLQWLGIFENPLLNPDAVAFPPHVRVEKSWPFSTLHEAAQNSRVVDAVHARGA